MLVRPDDWRPQGVEDLEPRAWDALRDMENSLCVTAGAGAGKTEFLAQKATYLLQTGLCQSPKRILAISFKRDAAQNLAKRVQQRCPNEQGRRFNSFTFDAFTKHLLDHFRLAIPEEYRPVRDYRIVFPKRPVFDDFLQRHGRPEVRPDDFERVVGRIALPIEQQNLNEADKKLLSGYWVENNDPVNGSNLTFGMINRLVEYLLRCNEYVRRGLQATYPIVFLDEFQDTTYPQYELLCNAFSGSQATFTAVGDDKQRIMGWAGAMEDAFAEFTRDFHARPVALLYNWRSHEGLVAVQRIIAKEIDPAVEDVEARGARTVGGNVAAIWRFGDRENEAHGIASWIKKEVDSGRIEPHDVAILVRMQANKVEEELEAAFTDQGLSVRNLARPVGEITIQDVLAEDLTDVCLPLLKLGTGSRHPEAWRQASDVLATVFGVYHDDEVGQEKLQRELESVCRDLRHKMRKNNLDAKSVTDLIDSLLEFVGRDSLQRTFSAYRRDADIARVEDGFRKLLFECAATTSNWVEAIERFEGRGQVPLMTIHKSKGLEFHTMIFFGLDDRTWWSLSRERPEEIKSFFVTFTRAEQRAFFSYCRERGGAFGWLEDILTSAGVERVDGHDILEN